MGNLEIVWIILHFEEFLLDLYNHTVRVFFFFFTYVFFLVVESAKS